MNGLLWVLQVLLSLAFLAHGWMFLFPSPEIEALMNASIPKWLRYFLGVAEVAAGIGLVVPGITRIKPWLVALAAAGLVPIMIGATVLHVVRAEHNSAVITFVLLAMAAFVAWQRGRVRPIAQR